MESTSQLENLKPSCFGKFNHIQIVQTCSARGCRIPLFHPRVVWSDSAYIWNHWIFGENEWFITNLEEHSRVLNQNDSNNIPVWKSLEVIEEMNHSRIVVKEYDLLQQPGKLMATIHYGKW